MVIKDIFGFAGKREWAALGILAACFAALLGFDVNIWGFVIVGAMFIAYASWTVTGFLASQRHFSGSNLTACVWPVGIAVVQAFACLGIVWVIMWFARHVVG